MSNVYSSDVWICATAYIVANSEAEAACALREMHECILELPTPANIAVTNGDDIAIYGGAYDPAMPKVSLSPSMTLYGPIPIEPWQTIAPIDTEDLIVGGEIYLVEDLDEVAAHKAHVDELLNDTKGG